MSECYCPICKIEWRQCKCEGTITLLPIPPRPAEVSAAAEKAVPSDYSNEGVDRDTLDYYSERGAYLAGYAEAKAQAANERNAKHEGDLADAARQLFNQSQTIMTQTETISALKAQVAELKKCLLQMQNANIDLVANLTKAKSALEKIVGPMEVVPPFCEKPTAKWMMEQRREYDLAIARAALAADELAEGKNE